MWIFFTVIKKPKQWKIWENLKPTTDPHAQTNNSTKT